jgi:gamma-glutamylcysteine synthetase
MELVSGVLDFGTAPEISVDAIARVTRISQYKIRTTYMAKHVVAGGAIECRVALHVDWDYSEWLKMINEAVKVRDAIMRECPIGQPEAKLVLLQH